MKSKKEINREMKRLYEEADAISDFLMLDLLSDERIKEELDHMQMICRSKGLALLWVMDDKYERI